MYMYFNLKNDYKPIDNSAEIKCRHTKLNHTCATSDNMCESMRLSHVNIHSRLPTKHSTDNPLKSQVWHRSGSDWPQMGQIRDFFR